MAAGSLTFKALVADDDERVIPSKPRSRADPTIERIDLRIKRDRRRHQARSIRRRDSSRSDPTSEARSRKRKSREAAEPADEAPSTAKTPKKKARKDPELPIPLRERLVLRPESASFVSRTVVRSLVGLGIDEVVSRVRNRRLRNTFPLFAGLAAGCLGR